MKILLTGGRGFLGSNFIEKYSKKYTIIAPTSAEMDLLRFETITKFFKLHKFDAVVHLAGKIDSRRGRTLEADNLIMFKNLQHATILGGVKKLIVSGDAADFDLASPVVSARENQFGDTIPSDGYGLGRYMIHLLASKDKISTVLRFFTVFGNGGDVGTNKIMDIMARGITGKKIIEIDADKLFSTIYIDDACKIIAAFLDNSFPQGDYNVAQDNVVSYTEIAKKVKAFAKKNGREVTIKVNSEVADNELTANIDKLKMVLPTLKFTSLTSAVAKTLDYLNTHKAQCRPKIIKDAINENV